MFWSAVTLSLITSATSVGLYRGWDHEAVPNAARATEAGEVTLVAEVTGSRLFAVNATETPQVVLFGSFSGAETRRVVPANGTLDVRIPHGARGHFWVEFVSFERGLRRTGPLPLDDLIGTPGDSLWVSASKHALHVSLAHGSGATLVPPTPDVMTALDRAGMSAPSSPGLEALAPHVPGATGQQNDNTPPEVGDEPLPPF